MDDKKLFNELCEVSSNIIQDEFKKTDKKKDLFGKISEVINFLNCTTSSILHMLDKNGVPQKDLLELIDKMAKEQKDNLLDIKKTNADEDAL